MKKCLEISDREDWKCNYSDDCNSSFKIIPEIWVLDTYVWTLYIDKTNFEWDFKFCLKYVSEEVRNKCNILIALNKAKEFRENQKFWEISDKSFLERFKSGEFDKANEIEEEIIEWDPDKEESVK